MTLFRAALVQAAKAVKVALSLEDFLTAGLGGAPCAVRVSGYQARERLAPYIESEQDLDVSFAKNLERKKTDSPNEG